MSQVVVVSGGAGGIGGATVARFVEGGARVVFTDWDEARGAELAASFADADNAPVFVPADVRDEAACATSWRPPCGNLGALMYWSTMRGPQLPDCG